MKTVQFGFGQIMSKTPLLIKRLRNTIVVAVAGSLIYGDEIAASLSITPKRFMMLAGLAVIAAKSIASLFGVPDDEPVKEATPTKVAAPNDAEIQNKS